MGSTAGGLVSPSTRGEESGIVTNDNSHHVHGSIYSTTNTFNAPITTIQQANTVNLSIPSGSDLELLNTLPKHPDTSSQWSDYLEDSRGGDLTRIRGWGDDLDIKESMLWVYGPAGTGKSTLARQLVYDLQSQNRLAASLFLSVFSTDTFGPDTALRLIGGEIGRAHHNAIPAIAEAVRRCHSAALPVLVEMFIRKPLESLCLPYPLIVVMDAADEWRSHYHFITELESLSSLSSLVRFVVLSRSEPRQARFKGISIRPYHLEPVSIEVMQKYLHARFEKIEWPFGRKPQDKVILSLATMASGLFIWIANVCSLLERPRANPHDTLTAILHHREPVEETHVLARLYFNAIGLLFPGPGDKEAIKELLGFMLVLQEPLTLDAFASLSEINVRAVTSMLSDLKALQIRHPANSRTMVYPASMLFHASFGEYLQNTSTPPGISFVILLPPFHLRLGIACLKAVSQIRPGQLNPPPKSSYGVKLWPYHVVAGSSPVEPDLSRLRRKVRQWPAFWQLARLTKALILKRPTGRQNKPAIRTAMMDLLEGVITFGQLCQWGPHFVKALHLDCTFDPPSGDNAPSLMRAVAELLEGTSVSTMMFQIPCLEVAVQIDPYNAESWWRLGHAYDSLAETTDSLDPIYQSLRASQHALDIAQALQTDDCARYMCSLAVSLWKRGQRLGTEGDIEAAIVLQRGALKLCPSGHPDRSSSLNNLANSLHSHFKLSDSAGDLEEAIVLYREALELCPSGHPDQSRSLNNLASSLYSRFEPSDSAGDLEEAIVLYREALELRPSGHPDRSLSLYNLAGTLYSLFQTSGSVGDLEEAIALGQEALLLRPTGHPMRPGTLWDLQIYLYDLFKARGTIEDLHEAIYLAEEALALYPPDSSKHGELEDSILFYKEELAGFEVTDMSDPGLYSDE